MFTPLAYFIGEYSCAVLALQTSRLPVRSALVLLMSLLAYKTLMTLSEVVKVPRMLNFGPMVIIGWAHAITLLLIERYELPKIKNGEQRFDIPGGIKMATNGRYIGTPREVVGLERWPEDGSFKIRRWLPAVLENNPKWTFVIERLITVIIIGACEHMMPALPIKLGDRHPKKAFLLRRLRDVSMREVWLRCLLALNFVISNWLSLNFSYQGFAAISVGLGWHEPHDWPRLFGNFSDLYSVRRLWSKFWHRVVYRPYGGMARTVLDKIPGLRKASPVYWILLSFIIFTISGCAHAMVTIALRFRCGWWADLHFYFLQFCAIVLEEAVDYVTRGGLSSRRWLGYIWVFSFLFWSVPKISYPHWKWSCVPLPT